MGVRVHAWPPIPRCEPIRPNSDLQPYYCAVYAIGTPMPTPSPTPTERRTPFMTPTPTGEAEVSRLAIPAVETEAEAETTVGAGATVALRPGPLSPEAELRAHISERYASVNNVSLRFEQIVVARQSAAEPRHVIRLVLERAATAVAPFEGLPRRC